MLNSQTVEWNSIQKYITKLSEYQERFGDLPVVHRRLWEHTNEWFEPEVCIFEISGSDLKNFVCNIDDIPYEEFLDLLESKDYTVALYV